MNQIINFLQQAFFSPEEFQFDHLLIGKETTDKDGKYKKDLFHKISRQLYGSEIGSNQFGIKQGAYKKTFFHFYLDEDLPEILLWETSTEIRKSLSIEELGTYMNNVKQGPCTILYRNSTSQKIICQEECEFSNNIKKGNFTRTYYFDDKKQRIIETGFHLNNCESKSTIVTYDQQDKQLSTNNITKTKYDDKSHIRTHRTVHSLTRIKCEYNIQTEDRIEEGEYSYSLFDIQYFLIQPECEIWRRGSYIFKNRLSYNYESFVNKISIANKIPNELELQIDSFLKRDENKRMGFFSRNQKQDCIYKQEGVVSPDRKFIILNNVTDRYDKTKTTLVFEKNLLMNSPLFDSDSFCFLDNIYIGLTSTNSKYYEPIYQTFLTVDEEKKDSILRLLFDKKYFKGHILFLDGDRNLITRDNVRFVSNTQFLKIENHDELISLRQNPNFRRR